jgi:hypothetical protein
MRNQARLHVYGKVMKRETYPQARERLFRELRALSFEVKDKLKVPQVTWHRKEAVRRIYFHKQAVYLDSLSMQIDIRGMSCDTFLAMVNDCVEKWDKIGR